MYVYVGVFFQLITVLCIFMYGLCPCACVAYDLINVMLLLLLLFPLVNNKTLNVTAGFALWRHLNHKKLALSLNVVFSWDIHQRKRMK